MIAANFGRMLRTALWIMSLILLLALNVPASNAARLEAPADFLPSESAPVRKTLESPVSGDFRNATLREVLDSLARQAQLNIVVSLAGKEPVYSGAFIRLPLRLALYEILRTLTAARH